MSPPRLLPLDAAGNPPLPGQTVVPAAAALGVVVDDGALEHLAMEIAERQGTANTRKTYRTAFRSLSSFLGPGVPPTALTAEAVAAWRASLERAGKAPRTVAVYLSAIRLLADEIGADPRVRRVKSERVKAGEPRALTPDELDRLLRMPDRRTKAGIRDLAILQIAARAGLRRAEAAAIAFDAIEERQRHTDPRLRQAVPASTKFAIRLVGKRGRERIVPLSSSILPALAAWRDVRPPAATDRLFVSLPTVKGRTPGPLDPRDIGRIVQKHARAAGLAPELCGVHVLRHTFATTLRGNGAALDTIRDLLGHEDIRTTQIYAKVDHAELEAAVDRLTDGQTALDRL